MAFDDLFAQESRPIMPTAQLAELLSGKTPWDEAPQSIRSWAAFYIHDAALQVMRLSSAEKRRTALGKVPDTIRPKVEQEIQRLWPIRSQL